MMKSGWICEQIITLYLSSLPPPLTSSEPQLLTCFRKSMTLHKGIDFVPESWETIDRKQGCFSESMPTQFWCTEQIRREKVRQGQFNFMVSYVVARPVAHHHPSRRRDNDNLVVRVIIKTSVCLRLPRKYLKYHRVWCSGFSRIGVLGEPKTYE